jgi:Asp-tRNA(Asn)/Glu-tRNA(Gln) amidotransferase A subunit family amidase
VTLAAEYDRRDGVGLAELVRSGEATALELVEEALRRADRVNPARPSGG